MLRLRLIFVFFALAVVGGCASSHRTPPPLILTAAQITASYYPGTPLSGPQAGELKNISFDDSLDVRARWFVLEHFDVTQLPLLASQARLITSRPSGLAVVPAGTLTADARLVWTDVSPDPLLGAGRSAPIGASRGALPSGGTVAFRAIDGAGWADQTLNRPQPRYLEVALTHLAQAGGAGAVQIGFTVQDNPPGAATSGVFQTETAIVEHPLSPAALNLFIAVPFKFTATNTHAVAAILTISPHPADADFAKLVDAAKSELASPRPMENSGPAWAMGLQRAMEALGDPAHRRAALIFLAGQSDADICLDVVCVCDDSMLEQIADSVRKDGPAALQEPTLDQFGWIMDRSSIAAMQPLLAKATLPPELFEVLTLHMGEPGRHAAAVDEIMHAASSKKDLQDRLLAENFIYLEDSSPAARVRSFDWLKARHLEPAGFDPLASPKDRRLALDKALDAEQAGGAQ